MTHVDQGYRGDMICIMQLFSNLLQDSLCARGNLCFFQNQHQVIGICGHFNLRVMADYETMLMTRKFNRTLLSTYIALIIQLQCLALWPSHYHAIFVGVRNSLSHAQFCAYAAKTPSMRPRSMTIGRRWMMLLLTLPNMRRSGGYLPMHIR
jgi:hypothetical protein